MCQVTTRLTSLRTELHLLRLGPSAGLALWEGDTLSVSCVYRNPILTLKTIVMLGKWFEPTYLSHLNVKSVHLVWLGLTKKV